MIRTRILAAEGQRKLARIRGRFANLGPVMQGPIRELIADFVERQFETEGAYGGTPWEPLSARRVAVKSRLGTLDKGILRHTDRMYEAMVSRGPHPELEVYADNRSIRWTPLVPYAAVHQEGSRDPYIPAREIIPDEMPSEFIARLRNIVTGYIVEAQFG